MTLLLSQLKPGQIAQVVDIKSDNKGRLIKLAGFGLTPGSFVKLQQRYPAYVLRIGETLLSLDNDVAQDIHVHLQQ